MKLVLPYLRLPGDFTQHGGTSFSKKRLIVLMVSQLCEIATRLAYAHQRRISSRAVAGGVCVGTCIVLHVLLSSYSNITVDY